MQDLKIFEGAGRTLDLPRQLQEHSLPPNAQRQNRYKRVASHQPERILGESQGHYSGWTQPGQSANPQQNTALGTGSHGQSSEAYLLMQQLRATQVSAHTGQQQRAHSAAGHFNNARVPHDGDAAGIFVKTNRPMGAYQQRQVSTPFIRPLDVGLANQLRNESMERAAEAQRRLQQDHDLARRSHGQCGFLTGSGVIEATNPHAPGVIYAENALPVNAAGPAGLGPPEPLAAKKSSKSKTKKSSSHTRQVSAGKGTKSKRRREAAQRGLHPADKKRKSHGLPTVTVMESSCSPRSTSMRNGKSPRSLRERRGGGPRVAIGDRCSQRPAGQKARTISPGQPLAAPCSAGEFTSLRQPLAMRTAYHGMGRTFDGVSSSKLEEDPFKEMRLNGTMMKQLGEKERSSGGRSRSRHKQQSSVEFSNKNGQLNVRIENTGFHDGQAKNISGMRSTSLEDSSVGRAGAAATGFATYSRNVSPNQQAQVAPQIGMIPAPKGRAHDALARKSSGNQQTASKILSTIDMRHDHNNSNQTSEILAAYHGRSGSKASRKFKLSTRESVSPKLRRKAGGRSGNGNPVHNPNDLSGVSIQENSRQGYEMNVIQNHTPYEDPDMRPRHRQRSTLAEFGEGVRRQAFPADHERSQKSPGLPSHSSQKVRKSRKKRAPTREVSFHMASHIRSNGISSPSTQNLDEFVARQGHFDPIAAEQSQITADGCRIAHRHQHPAQRSRDFGPPYPGQAQLAPANGSTASRNCHEQLQSQPLSSSNRSKSMDLHGSSHMDQHQIPKSHCSSRHLGRASPSQRNIQVLNKTVSSPTRISSSPPHQMAEWNRQLHNTYEYYGEAPVHDQYYCVNGHPRPREYSNKDLQGVNPSPQRMQPEVVSRNGYLGPKQQISHHSEAPKLDQSAELNLPTMGQNSRSTFVVGHRSGDEQRDDALLIRQKQSDLASEPFADHLLSRDRNKLPQDPSSPSPQPRELSHEYGQSLEQQSSKYNFNDAQARDEPNGLANSYLQQSKVAPDSPSPRFSQQDVASVENYGARAAIDAQHQYINQSGIVNQQSQNRRRNWQGLNTVPEHQQAHGGTPMVNVQSTSNTMTSEKEEGRMFSGPASGFGHGNFNTQDLMRMTQLSSASQLTGAASRTGAAAETTDLMICPSNINETSQVQSFDRKAPFSLSYGRMMPEQHTQQAWTSEQDGSIVGQTEDARLGGMLLPPSEGHPSHFQRAGSENNTETFRGQGHGIQSQLTNNKEGRDFQFVVGFNESHEISSLNPMNFTRSDLNASNNAQLELLLQNNPQISSSQERAANHKHSRQAVGEYFDSQVKNKTMTRMNGMYSAGATLDSNLTIKEGPSIRQPRILNKTMALGEQALRQQLSNLRMLDFAQRFVLKEKLIGVHQNLSNLQQQLQWTQMKQRVDAYSAQVPAHDYSVLNPYELLDEVCQLSKRLLAPEGQQQVNTSAQHGSQHQSHGLSRLSDIDSSFQVSKMIQAAANQAGQQPQSSQPAASALENCFQGVQPSKGVLLQTKQDLEQELQQVRCQKEESDAVINNLRKTIRDMAKQMRSMEGTLRADESSHGGNAEAHEVLHHTPSLAQISPRCRSEANNGRARLGVAQEQSAMTDIEKIQYLETQLDFKEKSKQTLQIELDQKNMEIEHIRKDNEHFTKQLKDNFRQQFDDQNGLIDEIKTELSAAIAKSQDFQHSYNQTSAELQRAKQELSDMDQESTRLVNELEICKRQLGQYRRQLESDQKTIETDLAKMQSSKEQEKHWRCGYEALFKKYTKLKDQLANRERDLTKLDHEQQLKIKQLTRRAEKAIRFFKDIAFERAGKDALVPAKDAASDGRVMADTTHYSLNVKTGKSVQPRHRLADASSAHPPRVRDHRNYRTIDDHQSPIHKYLGRSKSANSSFVQDVHEGNRTTMVTRAGIESPTRDHATTNLGSPTERQTELNRVRDHHEFDSRSLGSQRSQKRTYHRASHKTLSPTKEADYDAELLAKDAPAALLDGSHVRSPSTQRRLSSLNKLQSNIRDAPFRTGSGLIDLKILIAIEAMESSFAEIADYKKQTIILSEKYFQKTCQQMQDFQVLSYDYLARIDRHINCREELKGQLEEQNGKIEQLKEVISESRGVIQSLLEHNLRQKELKEAQWRNIINFDCMKDQEQAKLSQSVRGEVLAAHEMLAALHSELTQKQRMLEKQHAQLQELERMNSSAESQVCNQKSKLEEMAGEVERAHQQRDEMKRRLVQVENAIKDVAVACEVQHNAQSTLRDGGQPSQYQQVLLNSPSPSHSLAREVAMPGTALGQYAPPNMLQGDLPPAGTLNYSATASLELTNRGPAALPIHLQTQTSNTNSARHYLNTRNAHGHGDLFSLQENGTEIHSQEIVLHEEPGKIGRNGTCETAPGRTRGGTGTSTPGRGQVYEYQEQPLIALDWLSQIKAHVRVQKAQIDENQNYFDGLREVLNAGSCSEAAAARQLPETGQQTPINIQQHLTPPFAFSGNKVEQYVDSAFKVMPYARNTNFQDGVSASEANLLAAQAIEAEEENIDQYQQQRERNERAGLQDQQPSCLPTNFAGSGPASTAMHTPEQQKRQRMSPSVASHSLDSFINRNGVRNPTDKQHERVASPSYGASQLPSVTAAPSRDANQSATEQEHQQARSNPAHFQTFCPHQPPNDTDHSIDNHLAAGVDLSQHLNLNQAANTSVALRIPNLTKASIQLCIQDLVRQVQAKSKAIQELHSQLEQAHAAALERENALSEDINRAHQQITTVRFEKDQLEQVFAQENSMRRELEDQVDQQKKEEAERQESIEHLKEEIERLGGQIESMKDERSKIEQSTEYYENSFKMLEKHYLEEKEKSDEQIQALKERGQALELEVITAQNQLAEVTDQYEEIQEKWEGVQMTRESAQVTACQTELSSEDVGALIERNMRLYKENDQVNRDIQVLITSYDKYKDENAKVQEDLRHDLERESKQRAEALHEQETQKQLVINRLNQEIQEEIKNRQRKDEELFECQQALQDHKEQIVSLEAQKEQIELQAIAQKEQIDQLQQFSQMVANYNQQLQMQQAQETAVSPGLENALDVINQSWLPTSLVSPHVTSEQNSMPTSTQMYGLATDQSNAMIRSYSIGQYANTREDIRVYDHRHVNMKQGHGHHEHQYGRAAKKFIGDMGDSRATTHEDRVRAAPSGQRLSQFSLMNGGGAQTAMLGSHERDGRCLTAGLQPSVQEDGPGQSCGRRTDTHQGLGSASNKLGSDATSTIGEYAAPTLQQLALGQAAQGSASFANKGRHFEMQSAAIIKPQASRGHISLGNCPQAYQTHQHHEAQKLNHLLGRSLDRREHHQSIPGLDVCQQCIALEGQVHASAAGARSLREFCHMLVQKYVELARRMSELCLDAQGLIKNEAIVFGKDLVDSTHTTGRRDSEGRRMDETSSAGGMRASDNGKRCSRKRHGSCEPQSQTNLSSLSNSTPDLLCRGNTMSKTAMFRGPASPDQVQALRGLLKNTETSACSMPRLPGVLKPHQRELMIRRAFKFFHKDIAKFLPDELLEDSATAGEPIKAVPRAEKRREKLFNYATAMVQIAYLIFQAQAERQLASLKAGATSGCSTAQQMAKSQSLGIQDYQQQQSLLESHDPLKLLNKMQPRLFEATSKTVLNSRDYEGQGNAADSAKTRPHLTAIADADAITCKIDQIGASLDSKIDTFLQLLMTLKSLKSHQERQDSTLARLIDSLVSSISRMVHDMTEDTRALGDVKARLEESAQAGRQQMHQESVKAGPSAETRAGGVVDLPRTLDEAGDKHRGRKHSGARVSGKQTAEDREIEEIRQLGLVRRGTDSSQATSLGRSMNEALGARTSHRSKNGAPNQFDGRRMRLEDTTSSAIQEKYISQHPKMQLEDTLNGLLPASRRRSGDAQRPQAQSRTFGPDESGENEVQLNDSSEGNFGLDVAGRRDTPAGLPEAVHWQKQMGRNHVVNQRIGAAGAEPVHAAQASQPSKCQVRQGAFGGTLQHCQQFGFAKNAHAEAAQPGQSLGDHRWDAEGSDRVETSEPRSNSLTLDQHAAESHYHRKYKQKIGRRSRERRYIELQQQDAHQTIFIQDSTHPGQTIQQERHGDDCMSSGAVLRPGGRYQTLQGDQEQAAARLNYSSKSSLMIEFPQSMRRGNQAKNEPSGHEQKAIAEYQDQVQQENAAPRRRLNSRCTESSEDSDSPAREPNEWQPASAAGHPANVKHYKLVSHKVASHGSAGRRLSDSVEPRTSEGYAIGSGQEHQGDNDSLQPHGKAHGLLRLSAEKEPETRPAQIDPDLDAISSKQGGTHGHQHDNSGGNQMSCSQIGSLDHRRGTYTHGSRDQQNYDGSQEQMSHVRVMYQGSTQSQQVHRNTSKKSGVEAMKFETVKQSHHTLGPSAAANHRIDLEGPHALRSAYAPANHLAQQLQTITHSTNRSRDQQANYTSEVPATSSNEFKNHSTKLLARARLSSDNDYCQYESQAPSTKQDTYSAQQPFPHSRAVHNQLFEYPTGSDSRAQMASRQHQIDKEASLRTVHSPPTVLGSKATSAKSNNKRMRH